MSTTVSIRERIERVLQNMLQEMPEIDSQGGTVYRWDGRGLRDPETGTPAAADGGVLSLKAFDIQIFCDDENSEDGSQGDIGFTVKSLPVEIYLKILQDDEDPVVTAELANRWIYTLEKALMANRRFIEPVDFGNQQMLAIDTTIEGIMAPVVISGQRETTTGLRIRIQYEHLSSDPGIGSGVTAYQE